MSDQARVLEAQRADHTLFKRTGFDPELVEAMSAAFESTCDALGLTERTDPITTLVAEKIIEAAQRGAWFEQSNRPLNATRS